MQMRRGFMTAMVVLVSGLGWASESRAQALPSGGPPSGDGTVVVDVDGDVLDATAFDFAASRSSLCVAAGYGGGKWHKGSYRGN